MTSTISKTNYRNILATVIPVDNPFEPLSQESEREIQKTKLLVLGINPITVQNMRPHQYLLALELFESIVFESNTVDIIAALMNGGKSHLIQMLLLDIFKLTNTDTIFFTSYYAPVVEQFYSNLTNHSFIQELSRGIDDTNKAEYITIYANVEDPYFETVKQNVKTFSKIPGSQQSKIRLLPLEDYVMGTMSDGFVNFVGRVIVLSSLHGTNQALSKKLEPKITDIIKSRESIILSDEFQAGTPASNNEDYEKATGYDNNFEAVYFKSLSGMGAKKVIGFTGTVTAAHIDHNDFNVKEDLMTLEDVAPYSKKVKVKYIDDMFGRMESAINHMMSINKILEPLKHKAVCVLVIPNDQKHNDIDWLQEIKDHALLEHGLSASSVVKYYANDYDTLTLKTLQKQAEDPASPVKILVVKQKFTAGINIKNIVSFAMVRESTNRADVFTTLLQLWARAIRFWSGLNGANSWNDLEATNFSVGNICTYFLPTTHKNAWKAFTDKFAVLV